MYQRIMLYAITSIILSGCVTTPKFILPTFSEDVQPPSLIEEVEPVYPQEAKEKGLQGTVNMYLFVSEKGEIEKVKIAKSSGYDILDDEAIRYAKRLKFNPAKKEGNPTSIWITWAIDFDLEPVLPSFVPSEYVRKIKDLYRTADQSTDTERYRLLKDIRNSHEEYVQHLSKYQNLNYNKYIQKFVKPEVYEYWEVFWEDWPLLFVVFHDFVLRYPDSDEVTYATSRMLDLIRNDIDRIKVASKYNQNIRKKKDLLLNTIYRFLNEEYPQAITEDLKSEAAKYLHNE